ncbi:MAG: 3-alpha-hydroxysteroid dehydrogenase [Deltaproteobacteria bacterium]|nr:3-alpha-hydroxysteroid dehydrogenase [Deltaproteobacteria bacterium]
MKRLDGKVALVSGGARGLGRAMAEEFIEEGARVLIGDVLVEDARTTAEELGDSCEAIVLDVTDEGSWAAATKAVVDTFGGLDILVNNAGTAEGAPFAETTLESYRRVTEVNQTGVFLGMRAAVEPMTARGGGSIINISSIEGMVASPVIISYTASKWAVRGMTKAVAIELAPLGIRVNSIHPGHVHTGLASQPGDDLSFKEAMIEEHSRRHAPMGRTGTPREIAKTAAFLASEDSSYTTGAEFVVDGGFITGYPSPGDSLPG